ncbi:hypothetical protein [Halofilum ochraceum]|uniref:hypothetical protein n=1 Tax=Halofilum ochraceum TaxID=1611323 RepID=UPI0008D9C1F6|nr:hypothetical protein [Halofilum ochraceum]
MIEDAELVERAVRAARPHSNVAHPRWVAVRDAFACGSTVAHELCLRFGFDPEETVRGLHTENPGVDYDDACEAKALLHQRCEVGDEYIGLAAPTRRLAERYERAEAECQRMRSIIAGDHTLYGDPAAPHTPEQAHGDALAAIDELLNDIKVARRDADMSEADVRWYEKFSNTLRLARSHLTASGVPYVPESIKKLPGHLRSLAKEEEYEANKLHGMDEEASVRMARAEAYRDAAGRIGVYLSDALASAPAVHPDYPRATMDELRKVYSIVLKYIDRLNDPISKSEFNLDAAQMCDELEDAIAAAPSQHEQGE